MKSASEALGVLSIFITHLSTVSDLTNQIMIPESSIMDGQHRHKVYSLPHHFFFPTPHLACFAHQFPFLPCPAWEPVHGLLIIQM